MRAMLWGLCLTAVCASGAGCHRQVKSSKRPVDSDGGGMKKFSTLIGKAKERKGFFDTYQKGEELYLAVPKQRLGEAFLLHIRIVQGIGADPVLSGQALGRREVAVVAFERHGERLFLVQRPMRTVAKSNSSFGVAVDQAFASSIIQSASIESERPDGAAIINIRPWVLGDLSDVGELLGSMTRTSDKGPPRVLSPNKDRCFVEGVKSFPENVNVRANLTFLPPEMQMALPSVADTRFISLSVQYSFARLPEQPMAPRIDDDRIGFLNMARQDLSSHSADFMVRYANRWRLDEQGVEGQLVRPRRPIVFYIDPSVPAEYRAIVKEGVEIWQQAFAAAGWYQAVRAEPLPKGADPDDLRYPTIRWDVGQNGYRGVTSLMTDPRSGEILGAAIRLSQNMITSYRHSQLPLVGGRFAATSGREADELDDSEFEEHMAAQGTLLRTTLIATGALSPLDPMPLRMLAQGIKKTVMHEVGHALGLAHNFKASSAMPNERLGDVAYIRQNGLGISVMDYPGLNLPKGPVPNEWYYYTPVLGRSDFLAITWGYTRDAAQADQLARTAAQSGHVLGLFDSAQAPSLVDPTDQVWDLGSDPLSWARDRGELVKGLWHKLPERMLVDNVPYGELTESFFTLLSEYMAVSRIAVRYIGGQYTARDHVGDPDGKVPFSPVPKVRQREALEFLLGGAFAESTFAFAPELLARLGSPLPGGFGRGRHLSDVRVLEGLQGQQEQLLNSLLDVDTFARLRTSEMKFGAAAVLTLPELFDQLSQGLLSELYGNTAKNVGTLRRDLQRRYIERLGALLLVRGERGRSTDLHALSRHQLTEIKKHLTVHEKTTAPLDGYTRAHIAETQARISKLLDAHLVE